MAGSDEPPPKTYLGDGAYAEFDGFHIVVSAQRENGLHYVCLEPAVLVELIRFAEQTWPGITQRGKRE